MLAIEVSDMWKAVEDINDRIIDKLPEEPGCLLTIESDGQSSNVLFGNELIWSSENDERGYLDEDECNYEPLEVFIERELLKYLNKMTYVISAIGHK